MSANGQFVAVTGSGGYLGSNLVPILERDEARVVRHRRFDEGGGGTCVAFDLANPPTDAFARLGKPGTIVHLAWSGLPNYGSRHHYEVELPLHYQFLKKMVDSGARKILVAGTCFEYGKMEGCLHEDMTPDPSNPYGYAKDSLRRQLEFLRRDADFQLVWVRLFYLYGGGQPRRALLAQLDAAIERGDATFPMTGGEQLRDYLSVGDAAAAISKLATKEIGSHIVNVCSGSPISVRRLVEERIAKLGASIKPQYGGLPYSPHEAMAFWGDQRKLNQLLLR